jgi:quercetin dioxygenase-like cupin family protein
MSFLLASQDAFLVSETQCDAARSRQLLIRIGPRKTEQAMDYCDWVESQRGKAPTVVQWEGIPAETVADPMVSTHTGTVRKTWVGDKVVLTRVVVRANSRGKPHSHDSEQVSMILRGAVKVTLGATEQTAKAGSIVHIPAKAVHMFEILGEETEILDVYVIDVSAAELRKHYPD